MIRTALCMWPIRPRTLVLGTRVLGLGLDLGPASAEAQRIVRSVTSPRPLRLVKKQKKAFSRELEQNGVIGGRNGSE